MKHPFYEHNLPDVKHVDERYPTAKQHVLQRSKRDASHFLPSLTNGTASETNFTCGSQVSSATQLDSSTSVMGYNSAVHERAKRYILRNTMARLSREVPSLHATNNSQLKRRSLYDHVQPKVDTGLPRLHVKGLREQNNYPLGPTRPVNWSLLKNEIERNAEIRTQARKMEFESEKSDKERLTTLANLIRAKVKSFLSSGKTNSTNRYKVVVHLAVFQKISAGIHISSRCLWDARTDNSITIKMQGLDCDILVVIFLCYADVEPITC